MLGVAPTGACRLSADPTLESELEARAVQMSREDTPSWWYTAHMILGSLKIFRGLMLLLKPPQKMLGRRDSGTV